VEIPRADINTSALWRRRVYLRISTHRASATDVSDWLLQLRRR